MATSPNYSWPEPDNTDLVKNGALAIRTMGNAIDTTMATMTPKSTYTAKGSIAAATGASTPANLSVGNNGETLVADSSASTGLRYQGNYAAGKNKIINGDFNIWQRGTSFTSPSFADYTADRWRTQNYNVAPTTYSITRQTFTPGAAPVSSYNSNYFWRSTITTVGSNTVYEICSQRIEDVGSLVNTVTVSFYAKSDSTRTQYVYLKQNFGSGGSSDVDIIGDAAGPTNSFSTTTSWQRFTFTATVPSLSGKTIGANNFAYFYLKQASASGSILDVWGVQVELSNTATAFQTATGTIQGELAACQRYYNRIVSTGAAFAKMGNGLSPNSTTVVQVAVPFPVEMRVIPTSVDYANLGVYDGGLTAVSAVSLDGSCTRTGGVSCTTALVVAYRPYILIANNNTSAYLGFSAEL
jgi:hypothetical protein